MNRKTDRAFSLIELLVVIAIIGILSALVSGGILRARRGAKITQGVNQMRNLASGMLLFVQGNQGRFPDASPSWDYPVMRTLTQEDASGTPTYSSRLLHHPLDSIRRPNPRSYTLNAALCSWFGWGGLPQHRGVRITLLRNPSQTAMFLLQFDEQNMYGATTWVVGTRLNFYYGETSHAVFCDGSVQPFSRSGHEHEAWRAQHIFIHDRHEWPQY